VSAKGGLVRPAESFDALLRDPCGRYWMGGCWLIFFASHGRFSGTLVWGDPDESVVEQWSVWTRLRLSSRFEPHSSIFDVSRVDRIGVPAFSALARYQSEHAENLAKYVTRLAVVHGGGLTGATAAGFLTVWPMSIPTRAFGDVAAALEWLERAEDAALMTELHRVLDGANARPAILRDLEIFLELHPNATPQLAAHALGISPRSLQRRLSEQGTTFRRVLDATRVRLAQGLLMDSDASITQIALQVGLTSPQHLSTLFRKNGLDTPRAIRARRKS